MRCSVALDVASALDTGLAVMIRKRKGHGDGKVEFLLLYRTEEALDSTTGIVLAITGNQTGVQERTVCLLRQPIELAHTKEHLENGLMLTAKLVATTFA